MTTMRAFLDNCLRPDLDCVGAVRETVAADPRMRAALQQPDDHTPIDLISTAIETARRHRIPQVPIEGDQPAVGFFTFQGRPTCALRIPGAGWWAKSTHGASPIRSQRISLAYEVLPCRPLQ